MLAPAAVHCDGERTTGLLFTTPVRLIVVLLKLNACEAGRPVALRAGAMPPVPCTVAAPALAAVAGAVCMPTRPTVSAPSTSGVERMAFKRPFTLAPWAG